MAGVANKFPSDELIINRTKMYFVKRKPYIQRSENAAFSAI